MSLQANDTPLSVTDILKARARALARPATIASAPGDAVEVIEFRLAKERYAVERQYVREACPLKDLTPVPCTPPFLVGIVNVRGQILPVIDIKKFFELPEVGIADMHMVVIVHAADVDVGILADVVVGLRSIPRATLQASLPTLTGIRRQYLLGVSDQQTAILDLPRLVSDARIVVDEEVET